MKDIDVLAVLGSLNLADPSQRPGLAEARDAVAEMVAALRMVDGIWSSDQTANIAPDSPKAIIRAALARVGGAK